MDEAPAQAVSEPAPTGHGDAATPTARQRGYRASIGAMTLVLAMFSPAAFVVLGWFTEAYQDTEAASEVSHRLHEVVFGILFTIALVGAASQWRHPRRNLAGLLQLVVTIGILTLVIVTTVGWDVGLLLYLVPLGAILLLRPRVTPARPGPIWGGAVLLTLLAFPSLSNDILAHVDRARSAAQNHTTHWGAMATFAGVLLALGSISALRFTGYRLVAWTLGAAAIGYGVAANVFPFDASSHRAGFSIGLVAWGLAWLALVWRFDRPRARRARRFLRVATSGALVLAALFVGAIWADADNPPNVPHRPHPEQMTVAAADVDRQTCLGCHQTGTAGAPVPPHDLRQACTDGNCWSGRSDCIGCHQLDPQLADMGIMVEAPVAKPPDFSLPSGEAPGLEGEQLAAMGRIGADP